jgi:hypothetical protein
MRPDRLAWGHGWLCLAGYWGELPGRRSLAFETGFQLASRAEYDHCVGVLMSAEAPSSWAGRLRDSAMLYAVLGTFARFMANVMLLPLFLVYFTPGEQAVWWVFVALGGLANLADFGFGAMITRAYSFLWAGAEDVAHEGLGATNARKEPNLPRLEVLNATVRRLYLTIALVATGVLLVAGGGLLWRPIHEAGGAAGLWVAWFAYALMIGYGVGTSHWILGCQGINLVRDSQAAVLWGAIAYLVTGVLLLSLGAGLMGMVLAAGVRGIVIRLASRRAFLRVVSVGPATTPDRELLRKLWPNSRKYGWLTVGGWLLANAGLIVCSQTQPAAITASFGLTAQVGAFLVGLATLWLTTKWPAITILRAQGSTQEMSLMFARRFGWCVGSFVVMAVVVVLLGNPLLQLWGARSQLLPAGLLVVYLWHQLQQLTYVQFEGLIFTENVVPLYGLNVISGAMMLVLGWLLAKAYGVLGIVVGAWMADSLASTWMFIRRGFQVQTLTPAQFLRVALGGRV